MVVSLLLLLCAFLLTFFTPIPEPYKLVLFIVEAVILLLIVLPIAGIRGVP